MSLIVKRHSYISKDQNCGQFQSGRTPLYSILNRFLCFVSVIEYIFFLRRRHMILW